MFLSLSEGEAELYCLDDQNDDNKECTEIFCIKTIPSLWCRQKYEKHSDVIFVIFIVNIKNFVCFFLLKDLYIKNFLFFFERSILYAKNFVFREAADFPIPPPL